VPTFVAQHTVGLAGVGVTRSPRRSRTTRGASRRSSPTRSTRRSAR
jgi:hypothetical protein